MHPTAARPFHHLVIILVFLSIGVIVLRIIFKFKLFVGLCPYALRRLMCLISVNLVLNTFLVALALSFVVGISPLRFICVLAGPIFANAVAHLTDVDNVGNFPLTTPCTGVHVPVGLLLALPDKF